MGAFDDLVPSQGGAQGGAFNDLVPQQPRNIQAPEPMSALETWLSKVRIPSQLEYGLNRARGVVMGMADPVVGAVQFGANLLPDSTGIPQRVNEAITKKEGQYEAERKSVGSEGFDFARLGGAVAAPANLAVASKLPMATSLVGRATQGAGLGALGAAATPIADTERAGYWVPKALQIGTGATVGSVATPLVGKIGDAVAAKLATRAKSAITPQVQADQVIAETIAKEFPDAVQQGANAQQILVSFGLSQQQADALRKRVATALAQGKSLDAAALVRKADFDALSIPATRGQVTRDPMQYAREKNLRGIEGVGEPLSNVFEAQGQVLQNRLGVFSRGAKENYEAGTNLVGSLQKADEAMRKQVSGLYDQARQSAGKDLDVPLQGLAQDYAAVLNDFGDKVPSGVRKNFEALGLLGDLVPKMHGGGVKISGNQTRVFTIEDADKLLKVINNNVSNDPATNNALSQLRQAVKNAVTTADASGGPFAPAVSAAAKRFKLQESIPALKAAAEGGVAPDDFVRRYVIGGKTDEVKGLAKLLDADARQEARAQIGAYLQRAAYGENTAGDKGFAQESFNRALRQMGTAKLQAFFTPQEVFELQRIGRVGAYITSIPNAAAVNTSNSGAALVNSGGVVRNLAARAIGPAADVANAVKSTVQRSANVRTALDANPAAVPVPLQPNQKLTLGQLLSGGSLGLGGLFGSAFR